MCPPPPAPFGLFWSENTSILGKKLLIRTACHTFLASKDLEVKKNLYHVLSPEGSETKVSAHALYISKKNYFLVIHLLTHKNTCKILRKDLQR